MLITDNFFSDSTHKSTIFSPAQIDFLESNAYTKILRGKPTFFIKCLVRGKEIRLTPEEAVRQMFIRKLIDDYGYSTAQMAVEHPINFGREIKRADIVIFEPNQPKVEYIIVEVKKPKLKDGEEQLKSYCNAKQAPMGVWTNGEKIYYLHRMYYEEKNYYEYIPDIPRAGQKLKDILREHRTIDNLIADDKLLRENKSLSNLIRELADEVLANSGVDVFEEVFKLIYTKLFDEMLGLRDKSRTLEFWNYGESDNQLKETIQELFDKAKKKWSGIFADEDKIKLKPSHLAICVSSLQNVKLFNSNLDVIDDTFEYLMSKSQKGEKGQFFTPRYVIDMCVRMLNPKINETMIDTAAGSCGFPVHTMFYVWKNISNPQDCEDYVGSNIFAIDFDDKTVRVARTLNLIAGDGKTNVLLLNTLDYERWYEDIDEDNWKDIYYEGWKGLRKLRATKNDNSKFNFDIVMANPPFAGDIKESRIIAKYELGKNSKGKYQSKVDRDILFIERNLNFLKSGGRMAIILPQGRFNNSSDKYIRDFIAERCRILAVVGLHGNVFRPHTKTKTSVLFVQKWDEKLCPYREDYPIFFATMREPSKDNSGEKILETDGEKLLRDDHNHTIVKHDLFNHDGKTRDGIAEAFIEFAKREGLSFFEQGSFDAAKYKILSEELEFTEKNLSWIRKNNPDFRLDAEPYRKNKIKSSDMEYKLLKDLAIINPSKSEVQKTEIMVSFIPMTYLGTGLISNQDEVLYSDYSKSYTYFAENDIIIAKITPCMEHGKCAIARNLKNKIGLGSTEYNVFRANNDLINTEYLFAYLNRDEIRNKAKDNFVGTSGRQRVDTRFYLNLKIPIPSKDFQSRIKETIIAAFNLSERADENYHAAEKMLSAALNLENFKPSSENVAIKNFSASFGFSGRLDAEFYQSKYDDIESKIFYCDPNAKKLSDIVEYIFTGEYSEEYHDKNFSAPNLRYYIRGTDINNGRIISDETHYVIENRFSKFVSTGDILTGRVGTIGNFGVVDNDLNGSVCSDNIICFRLPKNYNPNVYALYFNNSFIKDLCKKLSRGSVQQRLNQETLTDLIVPFISEEIQEKIAAQVSESFRLRRESEKLLLQAKQAVELAIEQSEDAAIKYLR